MSDLRLDPVPEGKRCTRCGNVKPRAEYSRTAANSDGLYSVCKECTRWYNRERNYGLSRRAFEVMLAGQGGRCAICDKVPAPGAIDRWTVDHDHETGAVRGILCHRCNVKLAGVEDAEYLQAALRYLRGG